MMSGFLCWFHPGAPSPGIVVSEDGPNYACDPRHQWGIAAADVAGEGPWALVRGHPIWRDAELAGIAAARGDAEAALLAYARHGEDFLAQLGGAFAVLVLAPEHGRLIAAIDRMGQECLFYAPVGDGVVVANRAGLLANHPEVDTGIDPQAIHNYLYFHMIPAPDTIHPDVRKLQAAHRLRFEDGQLDVERYWLPDFRENKGDFEGQSEALRLTIRQAVACRLGEHTGSFLSGGLDSSTVTGMHAELDPNGANAYTIGFDQPGYDEIPFARTAANHFSTPLNECYVSQTDVADTVHDIIQAYDEPFGNSSALPAFFCARMARERGVRRMLAGDGGDELFAGNKRYAKQGIFELYDRVPAPVRRGLIEPTLATGAGSLPGLRKVRSYVEQARVPLPERMESYNFLHRMDPDAMFTREFRAAVDEHHPIEHLQSIYHAPKGASTLNRMLYLDWQITLADSDLRKVSEMCRLAGVEVVYPMLDDDLVELSCRIPSRQKLQRGHLRHFYKAAFRDFLPDKILNKKKQGFGLPFGVWLHEDARLHELAGDSLQSVRKQGWLRKDFIDQLMNERLAEHPAYYGDLVWVLMTLGIWLDRRSNGQQEQSR